MKAPLAGALAVLALLAAAPAAAMTCYVVFDRNDNVIYRDIYPPVDMSDRGAAEREAMRRRGEFLMFSETDRCPQIEFVTGNAGSTALDLQGTAPASTIVSARPAPPPGLTPAGK